MRAYKNNLLFLMLVVILAVPACNKATEETSSADEIRDQISQYRSQISDLNQNIIRLERKLLEMGEGDVVRNMIPVTTEPLKHRTFENYFRVTGNVEAVNTAIISPEISGHLQDIYVQKGDAVSKGQVIARLSTHVIENNIAELKTGLGLAETLYDRQKRLWDQQIGSELQYLEAKNNAETMRKRLLTLESQLDMAVMRSPINGFVDETFLKAGELAMPGSPIMQIINLDELYINADVSEAFLPFAKQGEQVILRFPSWPEVEKHVPLHRIGHVINPENRSFRIQLRIPNPQHRFKPNMMASISIKSYQVNDAIIVPTMLIRHDTQGHFVFLAGEHMGRMVARKTYVQRGPEAEGHTLIEEGLNKGDLLILQGYNRLADGDPLRINNQE